MKGAWVPHDTRDAIVDFVHYGSQKTEITLACLIVGIGLSTSKWYHWKSRYGKVNEHNAWIPRDHGLDDGEKQAIIPFYDEHPLEGYRRLTFMMLDADVVAVSPSRVYRVWRQAGLLQPHTRTPSKKGTGFVQPLRPHQHWHIDIAYVNVSGTVYDLCTLLDGYSRSVVHWEIRPTMTEPDVETIVQRAREPYANERPRILSDNGPQFLARDFQEYIRIGGMSPVTTSPYYPQSNGKIERFRRTIKGDAIGTQTPLTLEDAQRVVTKVCGVLQ